MKKLTISLLMLSLLLAIDCSSDNTDTGITPSDPVEYSLRIVDVCPIEGTELLICLDDVDTVFGELIYDLEVGDYGIVFSRWIEGPQVTGLILDIELELDRDIVCEVCSSSVYIGSD